MPPKELSKSMKAKLYDFTYSPFMSSMVISWIILNHKYILIYMASIKDFDKKLQLLESYNFSLSTPWFTIPYAYNFGLPIIIGLLYTFFYPNISKYFYKYTLNKNKELKTIKTDIEDSTPLTQEEAKILRKESYEKNEQILELENKITTIRNDYDTKITTIEEDIKNKTTDELNTRHKRKIKELQQNQEREYKEKEKVLDENYQNAYKSIVEERDTLSKILTSNQSKNAQLIKENKELLKRVPKVFTPKATDKEKVLRWFYESNYKTTYTSNALDAIVNNTNIARPKASQIIYELIKENILEESSRQLSIKPEGNYYLVKKFDKETKK